MSPFGNESFDRVVHVVTFLYQRIMHFGLMTTQLVVNHDNSREEKFQKVRTAWNQSMLNTLKFTPNKFQRRQ